MDKKRDLIAIVLVCLTVYVAYLNALSNSFIFDDNHMIVNNNYVKDIKYIPLFFKGKTTTEPIARGMYRPILMLSFTFNYLTGGLNPQGYRIINVLIHFLNAVFLYLFLKIFLKKLSFALRLGITLIFCLHPINTEGVTYISSRSDLLSSFFILSGVYAYIRSQGRDSLLQRQSYYLLSLGLYVLALLTKETGLVFIGLIAAYEFIYAKDFLKNIKNLLLKLLPFILLTLGYLILIKFIFGSVFGLFGEVRASPAPPRTFSANILTQAAVSFYYLYLFFFPFNLCIDHNFPLITDFSNPLGTVPLVLILFLVVTCLLLKKRILPIISFSCLWYFISLSPKFYARLNLVCAEHQAYLAFFSLYFLLGFLLIKWRIKKIFLRQLFFFILGLFFLLSLIRNFQWRDGYSLWRATLKVNPSSGIAKGNLGLLLQNRGNLQKAEEFLKDSADTAPLEHTRIYSLLNLANHYALRGNPAKGMEVLIQKKDYLLKAHPMGFYKTQGFIYMQMGEKEKAREAWQKALIISPNNSRIKAMLGVLYLEQLLDRNRAEEYFKESIKDDPDSALAYLGLAQISERDGDLEGAIKQYQKVIQLAPQNPLGYFFLGLLYAKKLSSTRAEYYFKKTIELSPDFAPAYYNLCIFYLSLPEPDFEHAQKYFDKASQLGYKIDYEIKDMLRKREITLEKDYYTNGHIGE